MPKGKGLMEQNSAPKCSVHLINWIKMISRIISAHKMRFQLNSTARTVLHCLVKPFPLAAKGGAIRSPGKVFSSVATWPLSFELGSIQMVLLLVHYMLLVGVQLIVILHTHAPQDTKPTVVSELIGIHKH